MKGNFTIKGAIFNKKPNIVINAHIQDYEKKLQIKENGTVTNGVSGRVTQKNYGFVRPIENARVVAYKEGIIYDYTKTDENGSYTLYLEDGEYDIKITSERYNRTFKNYKVTNGIQQYYVSFLEGQIREKYPINNLYKNVIEFHSEENDRYHYQNNGFLQDNRQFLITGTILDQHNLPTKNAELIVADSFNKEIKAFIKTKEDGKYLFMLKKGVYDIILRSPNHNAKIIRNYQFIPEEGFLLNAISDREYEFYDNTFNNRGDSIWISN